MSRLNSENKAAEIEIDLLGRAIDKEMNSKICSKSRTMKDVMGIAKKE
jgi:hypothetical protein